MTEPGAGRVAVYIDFDNIVISRYDQVHGRSQFQRDKVRSYDRSSTDSAIPEKLSQATVDVGAIIDFASSFGTLVLTRAYADWSVPVNADYRGQLVSRAVDLVQLFPAAAYAKNGADIRLAVDAVEDMFRLPDLSHVVIVAGDSDYIALAQRCRRLGRYVVGVGVAGSTSRSLAAACDELVIYDALPGIEPDIDLDDAPRVPTTSRGRGRAGQSTSAGPSAEPGTPDPTAASDPASASSGDSSTADDTGSTSDTGPAVSSETPPRTRRSRRRRAPVDDADAEPEDPQEVATGLLERALRLGHEKDDADWLHSSEVKTQMKRMDPSFSEKALGYRSFSDFIKSRESVAELDESNQTRLIRMKPEQ